MYICSNCWNESIKWQGKCNFCWEWNTLKEFKEEKITWWKLKWEKKSLSKLEDIEIEANHDKIDTKSEELNNVLWWWITKGSVILLSGEPWIGKSTITLELAKLVDEKIIYVSGEETDFQIASRAKRLGISGKNIQLLAENCIEDILETLLSNKAEILIIDSISVMHSKNITWTAGSISQVKFISELLVAFAKKTNTTTFIIWHITKDGNLAWPKTLEHLVDTVLYFEWDKYDNLRILRSLKNRFWATSEIWIFSMTEKWLVDLKNPEFEFVSSKEAQVGSSLSITIEWSRPLIIETESLTTYTKFGYPKRSARWINSSKLDLIVAVLGKYSQIKLDSYDVYTNIARGLKIEEPWIDLSIAVSIISSKLWKKIEKDEVFIWEISLTWMIKKPIYLEKRIKQAEKIWIKKIFVPADCEIKSKKLEIIKIKNIEDLIKNI